MSDKIQKLQESLPRMTEGLLAEAEKHIVDSADAVAGAVALLDRLNKAQKYITEETKEVVDTAKKAVDTAKAAHTAAQAFRDKFLFPINNLIAALKTKTLAWHDSEKKRIAAEAEADRKRIEAEAEAERKRIAAEAKAEADRKLAEAKAIEDAAPAAEEDPMEAEMRAFQAQELKDAAASTVAQAEAQVAAPIVIQPVQPIKISLGGAHTVTTWRAEVTDMRALVKAITEGLMDIDLIQPNAGALLALARSVKKEQVVNGVTITSKDGLRLK